VVCHPDVPLAEAFPIADYAEDATTDKLNKWCVRSLLVLADHYTRRYNARIINDRAYPHRDLCTVQGANRFRGIAERPTPDLIPTQIPDVATAARFGLADRVAKFIADGADVGQRDMFGFDALRWAVVRDYRPIFDLLIAAGGQPDFCAALEAAAALPRLEVIAPLSARCASTEQRLRLLILAFDNSGFFEYGPYLTNINGGNELVVRALLNAEPALLLTGSKTVADALLDARLDLVRLLLDHAAVEPHRSDEWWDGLLNRAVARWNLGVADLLLERGAHPGPGAVHSAMQRKAPDVVRRLARHGANLDGHGAQQMLKTVRTDNMLDPMGRHPPERSIHGDEIARRYADPPIFLALDPLMDFKMVDVLLELGADPNVHDSSERTPLMVAIARSRIYGRKNGMGWFEWYVPQHLIQGQEDWDHRGVEPVRALLAKGANVGLTDKDGLTALHYAARSDYNVEIAKILLEHGADINARDASGKTPLDHARAAKLVHMPEILTAAGARTGIQ
jgi:ankyrin repeat protein